MKSNIMSLHPLFRVTVKSLSLLLVTMLVAVQGFSQNATTEQQLGDLSSVKWKTTSDIGSAIEQEQAKMLLAMSAPDQAEDEKAMYHSYDRLLGYVLVELQADKPVDEAIKSSYEKVLLEAETDIELKQMPLGILATFIPGLIEVLTEVQQATPAN